MAKKNKTPDDALVGGKRFTIEFNAHDRALIENKVEKETEKRKYPVTVSDIFRELVNKHLAS